MKKLGFALGAGGSRGIAHVGFLKAMEEENIIPDFISGSSMGAVVGACYAGGMHPDKMWSVVQKLKVFHIIDFSFNLLGKGGLFRSKKYKDLIHKMLPIKTYEHLKIPFSCVATDLVSGKTVVLSEGDLAENVSASSAMPSIFRPIKQGDTLLVDGGVRCRVPVSQVRELGAEVVVAVDVLGQELKGENKFNTLNVLLRALDLADADLATYKRKHDKPNLYLDLEMQGMSQYKLQNIETAFNAGYEIGKKNAEKIKELIKD